MSAVENKAAIHRLIDEVWNQRAFEVLDQLFAAEAVISESGIPFPTRGPTCVKEGIRAICAAFPDIRQSIDDIFAEGDRVVVRWSSSGTHQGEYFRIAPTNRQVRVNGMAIYRFADGKIVEEWMNTDMLGLLRQLGVVPG
jgi:predicted ester cyclase